jgi:penicillin-binding protein 2
LKLNFKDKKIKSLEKIEPGEVFLDSLAQKEENDFFEKKFEVPLSRDIARGFFVCILILIFILFIQSFQFQVLERDKFLALAEKNKFIIQKFGAERGIIYDQNFKQIVFNQPSFDLVLEKRALPKEADEKLKILKEVSSITKKNFDALKKEVEDSAESQITIAQALDYQTLLILETKISQLLGFQIKNNTVRDYLDGKIFSPLLGYITKTDIKTGLEASYDEVLKEKPGRILKERDARGNVISEKVVSLPESGNNLSLWLNSELQRKIYQEMKKSMEGAEVKTGTAVALDPKTGGVLALVSFPSFDNNLFSKGMSQEEWESIQKDPLNPLFNQPIAGGYQTGSTIKPLLASAALEEKIISAQKKLNCQGEIHLRHRYDPEIVYPFRDWKIHGWTDLRKAIAESCNVYFYTIGGGYGEQEGLGPNRIKKYLELFGWGQKTGIDIPGESSGFLPDPEWKREKLGEPWTQGNTYHYSIGQEFLRVTPLQVAVSFSAIANGGKLLKPKLVRGILDSEKNLIEEIKPEIIREGFVKNENLEIVRQGMRQAVTNGSCTGWLDGLAQSAACKTGTAETQRIDPVDKKEYYNGWLVVSAPYENPEIVLVIFVKDVKKAHPTVLAPAKAIFEWYFNH